MTKGAGNGEALTVQGLAVRHKAIFFLLAVLLASLGLLQTAEAAGGNGKKPTTPEPVCDRFDPEVVFHRANSWTDSDLMVANGDGSCQTVVLDGDEVEYREPNWLPDGSGIVFFASAPYPGAPAFGIYYLSYADILDAAMTQPRPQLIVEVQSDLGGLVRPNPGPLVVAADGGSSVYEVVYSDRDTAAGAYDDIFLVTFSVSSSGVATAFLPVSQLTDTPLREEVTTNWLDENTLVTETCTQTSPDLPGSCGGTDYWILDLNEGRNGIESDENSDPSLFGICNRSGEEIIEEFNLSSLTMMPSHDGKYLALSIHDVLIIDVSLPCAEPTNVTNNSQWNQDSLTWTADDESVTYLQRFPSSTCGEKGRFTKTNLIIVRPIDEPNPCFLDGKLMEFPAGTGPGHVQWRPWP